MLTGITLSNGHRLTFLAASGALGFDGRGWPHEWPLRWLGLIKPELFTVILKTLTLEPTAGNGLLRTVRPLDGGAVNAVGLRNPGIATWLEKYAGNIPPQLPVIISLAGNDSELSKLASVIQAELGNRLRGKKIVGLEINLSCPNVCQTKLEPEKVAEVFGELKNRTALPLLAKLGYDPEESYLALAKKLDGIAEAVSINSVPWRHVYPDKPSPLKSFGNGGVSGQIAQTFTWEMAEKLSPILPVIGPSVWRYSDLEKLFTLGAQAIAFGSIFLLRPWAPTLYVRRWWRQQKKRFAKRPLAPITFGASFFWP